MVFVLRQGSVYILCILRACFTAEKNFPIHFPYFSILLHTFHTFTYFYILLHTFHTFPYFSILLHTFHTFTYFYILLHTFTYFCVLLHNTYYILRTFYSCYIYQQQNTEAQPVCIRSHDQLRTLNRRCHNKTSRHGISKKLQN
jgi:hypothetical protein